MYALWAFRSKKGGDVDEYQLWSSLALELLGKAALASIHPSLVADPTHCKIACLGVEDDVADECAVEEVFQAKGVAAAPKRAASWALVMHTGVPSDLEDGRRHSQPGAGVHS